MAEFINTADVIGDEELCDQIIMRTVTEYKESRISKVGQYAFHGCTALTKVDLPNVTTIGYNGFYGCTSLVSVNIPAVISIDAHNALSNCKALTEIILPCCTNLGNGAFSYCTSLRVVDCASNENLTIGNNAFSNCVLTALILRSNSVATLANANALADTGPAKGTGYIYVPAALLDSYKAATNWSNYAAQFRAIEDYPDITGG